MRDPQQARKETVRVTRPVARTERVRMEGEWDSVLSSQRPDKVIKTPVIITRSRKRAIYLFLRYRHRRYLKVDI